MLQAHLIPTRCDHPRSPTHGHQRRGARCKTAPTPRCRLTVPAPPSDVHHTRVSAPNDTWSPGGSGLTLLGLSPQPPSHAPGDRHGLSVYDDTLHNVLKRPRGLDHVY